MRVGADEGLDAVGVATAAVFRLERRHLESRKAAGLHGGMHFTYGDPERATDPGRALPGARSLVVGALSYRRGDTDPRSHLRGGGGGGGAGGQSPAPVLAQVARYSWRDHYRRLRAALGGVAARLHSLGWRAEVRCDDNALVDRAAAVRAGLGWYGKNALVLLPGRGSWFVLGSVVTDAVLAPTGPVLAPGSGCGPCVRCVSACPTGAIVAPGVVDARRCLAWLLEAPGEFPRAQRVALGARLYGCDECQSACPVNRRVDRDDPPPLPGPDDERIVDVLDLLARSDDELLRRFGRWYIPRRQARYLRRNALVVLGNVGDGSAAPVMAALRRALADPDHLVRSHAVWAARRLGRHDLLSSLAAETHPAVRAELEVAEV
jgi:epoxyqueuosine reductase